MKNPVVKIIGIVAICFLSGCKSSTVSTAVIPNVPEGYRVSFANACILNLRMLDNAKKQWALEHNATNGEVVTMAELTNYISTILMPNFKPICHAGGTYTIGKIGESPTCSLGTNTVPAHVLESKLQAP